MSTPKVDIQQRTPATMGAPSDADAEVVIVSYRKDQHAYPDAFKEKISSSSSASTTPSITCIHLATPQQYTRWYRFKSIFMTFVTIHYLMYAMIMFTGIVAGIHYGYTWTLVSLLGAYSFSFWDGCHLRYGRNWPWFRKHPIWHPMQAYSEIEVVRTTRLDSTRKYMFASSPHAIMILSRVSLYGGIFERLFPGIEHRTLGATPMFYVPGCREICLWLGAIDARKSVAIRALRKGLSLFVYPGGIKEIFLTNPHSNITTIIGRKGFIRLALQHDADIVPVFIFGEKWMYKVWLNEGVSRFILKMFRIPILVFWGRWKTLVPFRKRLSVVYDAPIKIHELVKNLKEFQSEKGALVSDDAVDLVYAEYKSRMLALFERHKRDFGYNEDEVLEIIDADNQKKSKHGKSK